MIRRTLAEDKSASKGGTDLALRKQGPAYLRSEDSCLNQALNANPGRTIGKPDKACLGLDRDGLAQN